MKLFNYYFIYLNNFINKLQSEFKMRECYIKLLDDETIIDNERFKVQRNSHHYQDNANQKCYT